MQLKPFVKAEDLSNTVMIVADDIFRSIFLIFSIGFGLTIVLIRMWILYYDLEISHIKRNQHWQMVIDSDIININNQRKYYNNRKYLIKIGFIIDIIQFGINCVFWYYLRIPPWIANTFFGLYATLKTTITAYIWQKYDSNKFKMIYKDCFDVRKEMKTSVIALIPYCLIALILFPLSWRLFGLFSVERSLCFLVFSGLVTLTWCYLTVPHVIKLQDEKFSQITSKNINNQEKSWQQTVSRNNGYELFMNHLETEFSVENLLFLTEYIQIKNVVKSKYQLIWNKMINDKTKTREIKFNVKMGIEKDLDNDNNDGDINNNDNSIDKSGIPVSKIAKQLSDKLNQLHDNDNNDDDGKDVHEDKKMMVLMVMLMHLE